MTTAALTAGETTTGLGLVGAGVDDYLAELPVAVSAVTDAGLLAEMRELERVSRRLASVWNVLLPEAERRGLAGSLSATSLAAMLQAMLRLSPHAAARRVAAARDLGPRVTLTGEQLPPILPAVADAVTEGALSDEQAREIARVLEQLPSTVPVEQVTQAERQLVTAASQLAPRQLGQLGQRILAHLDPDGVLGTDAEHQRRRSFALIPQTDGSYQARGQLTPSCGAALIAALTPRSAPQPAQDGPDPRSYGQRMHDALADLADIQLRRNELIDSGAPAQIIITMSAEQLRDRTGYAETSFGQLISVPEALRLAGEADLALMLCDGKGAVLAEHRTKRIATRSQTLALIARDRGCSFPDCDRPPEWTQRHHIIAWQDGGLTNLDNLTLLCRAHHRRFETEGWQCQLINRLPHWIPPNWIDPERTPRLNHRIQRE
ncbi:MAG TPA: DUF222 domain-containing protein [Jatrophihabitans sp.]|nr:DUF222 domain-containing protein [Jatrophihabitans sp.]